MEGAFMGVGDEKSSHGGELLVTCITDAPLGAPTKTL